MNFKSPKTKQRSRGMQFDAFAFVNRYKIVRLVVVSEVAVVRAALSLLVSSCNLKI